MRSNLGQSLKEQMSFHMTVGSHVIATGMAY